MRRVLLLVTAVLIYSLANSQTMKVSGQVDGNWGPEHIMNTVTLGGEGYFYFTIQATSGYTNAKFLFHADGYFNKWNDVTANVNTVNNYTWHNNSGGSDNVIDSDVSNGKYYTFRLENNGYNNSKGIVMETSSQPRTITNVSYSSNSLFSDGDPVTVTITINDTKSLEENFYVRYTTNAWASSSLSAFSFSGTTGTATIPAQSAETTVQFYVFSTTLTNPSADFDLVTLNYNNNSGSNYSYTVNYGTAQVGNWGDNSTWNSSSVPESGKSVAINHNVTLNQEATVSGLFIKNGVTFTASDGSKANRKLTISGGGTLSNYGTFDAADGIVEFAGTGTISGTISFYNVEISGQTDFGSSSTITNNLTVNSAGFAFGNAPVFATNSNLIFATGAEYWITTDMILWKAGNALEKGVPHNVIVTNSTPFHIYADRNTIGNFSINSGVTVDQGNNSFQVGGDFINNGSFYIVTNGTHPLIVGGDFFNNASALFALSTTNGGDLKVAGDFTDNGTFAHNNRAVFFNGTTEQIINGTSTTSLGYVFVEADAIVSLASNKGINIVHDLNVNNGSKGAGSFEIKSDATGTGSLIISGTATGNISVHRYLTDYTLPLAADGWHFLSSPVESQAISTFDNVGGSDDFYSWDEPTGYWINRTSDGPVINPDFEDNFIVGKGYLVAYEDVETKTFFGTPNNAQVINNLSYSGPLIYKGWNLLGNPFASAIDWDLITRSVSVNGEVHVYDESIGDYISYNGAGDLTGGIIPAMQGFMVLTTAVGQTLTIDKDDRVISSQGFYKSENIDLMKVSVSNGEKSTNLYVRFNPEATNEFDSEWDAHKLFGFSAVPKIFAYDNETKYSINSLPATQTAHEVSIGVRTADNGQYSLTFANLEFINSLYNSVKLEDRNTNTWVDIEEGTQYHFTATEGDNENRFKLHFGVTGIDESLKTSWTVYASGNQLHISGLNGPAELSVFNVQGQQVMLENIQVQGEQSIPLNLATGVYLVQLNSGNTVETTKVIIK